MFFYYKIIPESVESTYKIIIPLKLHPKEAEEALDLILNRTVSIEDLLWPV